MATDMKAGDQVDTPRFDLRYGARRGPPPSEMVTVNTAQHFKRKAQLSGEALLSLN